MGISKNSSITASDLTNLKDTIKKELNRRSLTATDVTFAKENTILVTQINTLIGNLKKIDNSSWVSNAASGDLIEASKVNTLATKAEALSTLSGIGGSGGCSSGCTGLCYNACTSSCATGCSGSCSGGCQGSCSSGCSGGCTGCGGNCYVGDCQGTCLSGNVETYPGCNSR